MPDLITLPAVQRLISDFSAKLEALVEQAAEDKVRALVTKVFAPKIAPRVQERPQKVITPPKENKTLVRTMAAHMKKARMKTPKKPSKR